MFRFLLLTVAIGGIVFAVVSSDVFGARKPPLPPSAHADLVVIEKDAHRLTLFARGRKLRSYVVALGRGGMDAKTKAGDDRTPEGHYEIDRHETASDFYRAIRISYPSAMDRKVALARGVAPGGAVTIHGLRNHTGWIGGWHRLVDWTDGSIAVTDGEIDEIGRVVRNGTPVEIRR
jgi:murein L,D-transpeptidase YafK